MMLRTPTARPDREAGYGLAVVLILAFVILVFTTTAFLAMQSTQQDTREQRNITSARGAADGGAEELIYELGLTGSQWDSYADGNEIVGTVGDGEYTATVTPDGANRRIINVVGEYPAGSGDTVEVEVVVERDSVPEAFFGLAMFADSGIDIHHHSGSTWLAPRVISEGGVHTNGYAKIDGSAEFQVNHFTAVGEIEAPAKVASVGSHPNLSFAGGNVPYGNSDFGPGGYTWRYDVGDRDLCYPGAIPHPEAGETGTGHNADHSVGRNGCDGEDRFFGGVLLTVTEAVEAGGLSLNTFGVIDGNVIVDDDGTFDVADGTITGTTTRSAEPPSPIEFPSLDFESTYLPRAEAQEGANCGGDFNGPPALLSCGVQHVFEGEEDFYELITDPNHPTHNFYMKIKPNGDHAEWNRSSDDPSDIDYILARGDWYIEGGVGFDLDSITDAMLSHDEFDGLDFEATFPDGPPPLVIAGSLITPDGGMEMKGRLYLVGRGNRTDFIDPSEPRGVDESIFLSDEVSHNQFPVVEPGVLAAGRSIDGKDYDDDSPWETDADLEAEKSNATWIRGLVYSGEWDDGAQRSEPGDQHWHNYDPKNQVRIFGAQVGGKLHDCNNFEFTYDDVVQNAFGFTDSSGLGGLEIVSWDEL